MVVLQLNSLYRLTTLSNHAVEKGRQTTHPYVGNTLIV